MPKSAIARLATIKSAFPNPIKPIDCPRCGGRGHTPLIVQCMRGIQ
jgi:hypothetical protein